MRVVFKNIIKSDQMFETNIPVAVIKDFANGRCSVGNWWIQSIEWLHLQGHKQLTNFSGISHSLQKNDWSIGLCRREEFHSSQVNLLE